MFGPFGHLATVVALIASCVGATVAFLGARAGHERSSRLSRDLAFAVFGFVFAAFLLMEAALITHDFSVEYVAQVGARETPLFYTIASAWSALEGSILLWALILAAYTAAFAWWSRRSREASKLETLALGFLFCVNVFFLLVVVWPGNPFEAVIPAPENGPGPNPLLQNHPFMAVHPPLLYSGYVGMAIPFSLGMAGLAAKRLDRRWARIIRGWTILPWTFLTLGIVAGAWWSYEVLGWGGYWAWDPVENASFMPWLTATAFLHSLMVQERRSMLNMWTVSLAITTFLLTLLGTFITRSGVLASVHAFTEGLIGPFFLGFLALALLVGLTLLAWRADALRAPGRLDSALSRETVFLVNNLLLAAFAFVVLLGTIFPLVVEAVQGRRVSVGEPFFEQMGVPLAVGLILLIGVGPAFPWGRADPSQLRRKFTIPLAVAALAGVLLFLTGVRQPLAWLTFVLAVLSAGLMVGEFAAPVRARRRTDGESWFVALTRVTLRNRRRYGGYIVHFGVLLIAVGIAASSTYRQQIEWRAEPGVAQPHGRYAIALDSIWAVEEPQRESVIAAVSVFDRDMRPLGRYFPRFNYYPNSVQPIGTPAVREGLREDLYLVLAAYSEDGSQTSLLAIISPLVGWIWAGGILMALGALFAGWPRRRRAETRAGEVQPAEVKPARRDKRKSAGPGTRRRRAKGKPARAAARRRDRS